MPRKSKPSYLLHRPTGQARVRLGGKDHYLGEFGSDESKQRYEKIISDWLGGQDPSRSMLTIDDLTLAFCAWGEDYYRRFDGAPSGELQNIRGALEPLTKLFGNTPISCFGPLRLKSVREEMVSRAWCRTNINRQIGRIKRVFAWGAENEIVPPAVFQGVRSVAALRLGRTSARESKPIMPVDESIVMATLPELSSVLRAMIRLQLLCGMRPGEVCIVRPCDISMRTDGVWVYRPAQHKNAWRDKSRVIFIGPEGQEVLRTFLDRPAESLCFTPSESEVERSATRRENRKTPMTPSQAARQPKPRHYTDKYTADSYGKAVRRACRHRMPADLRAPRNMKESIEIRSARLRRRVEWESANVWSPNRLRHLRATMVRERFGLEVASVVLGHSGLKVTEVYAQRNEQAAADAIRQIG
jgi:integrase